MLSQWVEMMLWLTLFILILSFQFLQLINLESFWTGPSMALVPSQFGYDAPFKDVSLVACYSTLRAKLPSSQAGEISRGER